MPTSREVAYWLLLKTGMPTQRRARRLTELSSVEHPGTDQASPYFADGEVGLHDVAATATLRSDL